ncbi:MAG: hypothetical protein QXX51_01335 [Candidatus Bathyarchaeia archaeon]
MKKWIWRKVGLKLELLILEWLKEFGVKDLTWDTCGRIDFFDGLFELEAKRLRRTKFVSAKWLHENVIERFSSNCPMKILVVTKDCWDAMSEAMLRWHGVKTIVVGSVDRQREIERAKERFMEQFLEVLYEVGERCVQKAPSV